jgi:O-antigen/teichoic acid export membrane protein
MGIIINQGFKNSLGFYLGVILGAINILFVSTYFLSSDELAVSRLLIENSFVLAAFVHLGSPHILDRFFAKFKDEENQHNGLLMYLFIFPHIGIFLLGIIYFIFKENIQQYFIAESPSFVPYLWLSIPMSYFWAIFVILDAYLRAYKITYYSIFLRETILRGINIITIILYGFKLISFDTFLYLQLLSLVFIVVFLFFNIKKNGILYLDLKKIAIKKSLETLKFSGIVIFGGLGANLIMFIDRNIIAHKIGTQAAAIFMISTYLASIIEIPLKAIKQIAVPFLSEYFINSDFVNIENLYKKASSNFLLLSGLMFILIFFSIEDLLNILPKKEIYSQGKWVVIVIAGGKCLEMALGLNSELIAFSKYFKFNTYLILFMMVCIVIFNYYLIPIYGVLGSAFATAFVTILSSVIRLVFVKIKFGFTLKDENYGKIIVMFILMFFIGMGLNLLSLDNLILSIVYVVIKSSLIFVFFLYFCLRFNFSNELTDSYNKIKSRILS